MRHLSLQKLEQVLGQSNFEPFIVRALQNIQLHSHEDKKLFSEILEKTSKFPRLAQRIAPFKDSLLRYMIFIVNPSQISKFVIKIFKRFSLQNCLILYFHSLLQIKSWPAFCNEGNKKLFTASSSVTSLVHFGGAFVVNIWGIS